LASIMRSIWSFLRRLLVPLGGLTVLILIIAWMSGWFHAKIAPGEVERKVATIDRPWITAKLQRTEETVDAVGTVQPRRKISLASQVLATIREIAVHAGDRVKADQVLVVLDDRDLQAQRREAVAAMTAANAELATRARDSKRYKMLLAGKAVSKEEYDKVEGAYQVAEAQFLRAKEQVSRIDVLLSYTQIRTRMAGIVADRFADPGDLAAPGKPLLAIHDPRDLELHAHVRETLAGVLRPGMTLSIHVDAAGLHMEGKVREIVPQAEAASRSVLVKIALPADLARKLYMGMFGRVAIPVGFTDRIMVPVAAVQYVGQLELVEVVGPRGPERRFIRTGRRFGDKIEILSGLNQGEKVLLPSRPTNSAGST
jgi:membrane fusion protein, multidrug efflux system